MIPRQTGCFHQLLWLTRQPCLQGQRVRGLHWLHCKHFWTSLLRGSLLPRRQYHSDGKDWKIDVLIVSGLAEAALLHWLQFYLLRVETMLQRLILADAV